jgi:histone deacetylase HOS3
LTKASQFFEKTESTPESSLILISAGFDANIHEQAGMQRHGKSVPPRFYEVFTRDTVALADKWTSGKCISVLEGGYSDRALTSGAIAHLAGLGGIAGINEDLYQPSSLYQLEKIAKTAFTQQSSSSSQKRRQDALSKDAVWLDYALEAFRRVEEKCGKKRIISGEAGTAPVTPNRAMMDQLWKSPRETRSAYRGGSASARPSPSK